MREEDGSTDTVLQIDDGFIDVHEIIKRVETRIENLSVQPSSPRGEDLNEDQDNG